MGRPRGGRAGGLIAARAAALARASHPEPVVGVTVMAAALAYTAGRGPFYTAVCGAAVLAGQLFVGDRKSVV